MSADDKAQVSNGGSENVAEPATTQPAEDVPPTPDMNALQKQLAEAKAESQRYMEGWQRERADFANYKRRIERETKEASANASINMLLSLLPIIDDFELAMGSIPQELQENPWLSGVQLVQRKFQKLLDENNVTVIDPVGEIFDAMRHEAIASDDSTDQESGTITVTLQKGYLAGDKVLRPARVKVAK
ncbi:MAG: nucleotide exchange factor GrpE [Anaerolineae bacterium]